MITKIEPIEPLGNILLRDVLHLVREYTGSKLDDRILRLCSNMAMVNLYNSSPDIAAHYGTKMSGTLDRLSGYDGILYLNSPVKNNNALYGTVGGLNELSGMRKYVSYFYQNKNTIESATRIGYNKFGEEIQAADPGYTTGEFDDILVPSHIIALITDIVSAGKVLHPTTWTEFLYRKTRPTVPYTNAKGFWGRLGDSLAVLRKGATLSDTIEIYFARHIILDNLQDIDTINSGYNANIDIPQSLFSEYYRIVLQYVSAASNKTLPVAAQPMDKQGAS